MTKEIDRILETLWDIRNNDKFYFKSYGEQMITELIEKNKKDKIMSKEDNSIEENKALNISGIASSYLIKFNKADEKGNMFLPNSINLESLNQMKISVKIKDYEIDENGVKVIKDFRIDGVSF